MSDSIENLKVGIISDLSFRNRVALFKTGLSFPTFPRFQKPLPAELLEEKTDETCEEWLDQIDLPENPLALLSKDISEAASFLIKKEGEIAETWTSRFGVFLGRYKEMLSRVGELRNQLEQKISVRAHALEAAETYWFDLLLFYQLEDANEAQVKEIREFTQLSKNEIEIEMHSSALLWAHLVAMGISCFGENPTKNVFLSGAVFSLQRAKAAIHVGFGDDGIEKEIRAREGMVFGDVIYPKLICLPSMATDFAGASKSLRKIMTA